MISKDENTVVYVGQLDDSKAFAESLEKYAQRYFGFRYSKQPPETPFLDLMPKEPPERIGF